MPVYGYACETCGPFSEERGLAAYALPCACPQCGGESARALALPSFGLMDAGVRKAMAGNERSRNAPTRVAGGAHKPGCGCCSAPKLRSADGGAGLQTGGSRPWMISH